MNPMCFFCRSEMSESQCSVCKRWVCIQCSENHNCYPRDMQALFQISDTRNWVKGWLVFVTWIRHFFVKRLDVKTILVMALLLFAQNGFSAWEKINDATQFYQNNSDSLFRLFVIVPDIASNQLTVDIGFRSLGQLTDFKNTIEAQFEDSNARIYTEKYLPHDLFILLRLDDSQALADLVGMMNVFEPINPPLMKDLMVKAPKLVAPTNIRFLSSDFRLDSAYEDVAGEDFLNTKKGPTAAVHLAPSTGWVIGTGVSGDPSTNVFRQTEAGKQIKAIFIYHSLPVAEQISLSIGFSSALVASQFAKDLTDSIPQNESPPLIEFSPNGDWLYVSFPLTAYRQLQQVLDVLDAKEKIGTQTLASMKAEVLREVKGTGYLP